MRITFFLESFPADKSVYMVDASDEGTYSYFVRLSSASTYFPSSAVPTICQLTNLKMAHTSSEERPEIIWKSELFRIITLHLYRQLLEYSRNRFYSFILIFTRRSRGQGRSRRRCFRAFLPVSIHCCDWDYYLHDPLYISGNTNYLLLGVHPPVMVVLGT